MPETIELKELVEKDLSKNLVGANILLDRFKVIDDNSRKTAVYNDPRYAPFYYHLGKYVKPKKLVEFGFGLGFISGSFLTSCKSVERFVGFQPTPDEFYSPTLGKANIKRVYKGNFESYVGGIFDKRLDVILGAGADFVIMNEETTYENHRVYMEFMWERMSLDGFMVIDHAHQHEPCRKAFADFCKIVNREPVLCKTRYGAGLIKR